jgi:hypothetical protein
LLKDLRKEDQAKEAEEDLCQNKISNKRERKKEIKI